MRVSSFRRFRILRLRIERASERAAGESILRSERNIRTGLSTIFGGGEARFEGAFGELIDVTAVTRERGSHNARSLNTLRTHRSD